MRYAITILSLLVLSLFLFSAFQEETLVDAREVLIQAEVEKRLGEYAERRLAKCRRKVMDNAEKMVDSILIEEVRKMTIDTFQKPPIPDRPEIPEVPIVEDTTDIAPLILPNEEDTISVVEDTIVPERN